MPTYQYRCADCGREIEVVQKFTDAALTECPECSGTLRKVFNAVGVVFKGSGFYKTDNRAASGKASGEGSAKGSDSGSAGKESKGSSDKGSASKDSAPAAKKDAPAA